MKQIVLMSLAVMTVALSPFAASAAPAKSSQDAEALTLTINPYHRRTVKVDVPAGFDSVTLEICTNLKRAEWKTVGTKATPSTATASVVEFRLERAVSRRFLRVNGKAASSFAGNPHTGPSIFLADPAVLANGAFASSISASSAMGGVAVNSADATSKSSTTEARNVSESDIWRVSGDRLYFYNELRGLQVFDISTPDSPALLGQMRTTGWGDQMYLLDASHVALLTHVSDYSGLDWDKGSLIVADVSVGAPKEAGRASYNGWLRESRLVGNVLYVISESYSGTGAGLQVTSFDVSNPASPVKRDTLPLGGWGGVVTATDRFLFVTRFANDDWSRSIVDVIDITSPTGILKKSGSITTAGVVNDKFKMQLKGDTFTVVSAISRRSQWINGKSVTLSNSKTAVETFSLANPALPVALGSLDLGVGESVRATRFDEDKLYVVTFFSIDPLWVVDLSTPKQPKLLGELKVPGFSSYIEPLGDRLVAIGSVDGRTAVSLFDVSDPANPTTLSQLPLGDGTYSYSEATWNEKAFNVVPEENLIVVPYSGYDSSSGYASKVQLIDLKRNALTKRGIIDHSFSARRTAVVGDRILAISSSNLVTVDFSNRDRPKVTSDVEIAWHVDRVFLSGNFLVQIGKDTGWNAVNQPAITVTSASAPDLSLNVIDLEKIPVAGSTLRDGKLYIAQQNQPSYYDGGIVFYAKNVNGSVAASTVNKLTVSIYDVTNLPAISLLGKTTAEINIGSNYGAQLKAVWPAPGILVWIRQQSNWGYWWGGIGYTDYLPISANATASISLTAANRDILASDSISSSSLRFSPYFTGDQGSIEAAIFDVSSPKTPVFASVLNIRAGATTDWSEPFASNGKLFVSSMAYENLSDAKTSEKNTDGSTAILPSRNGRHFLRVVSFDGPAKPTIGPEINIPGRLVGISRFGGLLLTAGPRYTDAFLPTTGRAIHSSAFDGTAVHFISQIPLSSYDGGYAVDGETTLISLAGATTPALKPSIQAWTLDFDGKFQLASTTETDSYGNLITLHGLALIGWSASQHVYDVTNPGKLIDLGSFSNYGGYGVTLENSDADPARGLWEAMGDYGVSFIEFGK